METASQVSDRVMHKKPFTVYLAGHIGLEKAEHDMSWREYAAEKLNKEGITTKNPLEGKPTEFWKDYSPKEIMVRDLKDVAGADLVLACMEEGRTSIGTPSEMFYAYSIGVPVVLVTKSNEVKNNYWAQGLTVRIFEELDDALKYVIDYWAKRKDWDPRS